MTGTGTIASRTARQAVPALPRAQPDAEGAVMRRAAGASRGVLGAEGRHLRGPAARPSGSSGATGPARARCSSAWPRILRPDRGTIDVDRRVAGLLELGAGFHPELSGRENVYLNGAILGMTRGDRRASSTRSWTSPGSSEFIDLPVKNYSSGMYVRLGFSVAINVDPDILVVDEVLAVGDEPSSASARRRSPSSGKRKKKGGGRGGRGKKRRSAGRSSTSGTSSAIRTSTTARR